MSAAAATPTVLATIVQLDPIWVNFNISEQDVIRVRAALAERGATRDDVMKYKVEVALQDETDYPHVGLIDYVAPTLSTTTGTLAVRGLLQNPKNVLLPGYFVRVRVPRPTEEVALLVPDVALGSDQGGRYVLVVNNDNVVEQRKVEIGPLVGNHAGDRQGADRERPRRGLGHPARDSRSEGRSAGACSRQPPPLS